MFTLENWKVKLFYISFGCICAIIIWTAVSIVTAEHKAGFFEVIFCKTIHVTDAQGNAWMTLEGNEEGGVITLMSPLGYEVNISTSDKGGHIGTSYTYGYEDSAKTIASMGVSESRATISAIEMNPAAMILIQATKDGNASIFVGDKDGNTKVIGKHK